MPKAKPSILLILKDAKLRSLLQVRFEREGYRVHGADDAEEGERKAVKARPNIFLVEVEDATNIKERTRHWKSLPTLQRARIVVLMPRPERSHVDEALTNGADQVILSGTLTPKEFVESLSRHLE
jgi:DNA-binding response OmpR family regulator